MSVIAFRTNQAMQQKLKRLAKQKGVNVSSLIKVYLTYALRANLDEITENGMTVFEEMELLMMSDEGGDVKIYDSVDDYIKSLNI